MSYITNAISKLADDRLVVHQLRLHLIAHLRKTQDPIVGNSMIQEYVDGVGIYVGGDHNYLGDINDAMALKTALAPSWTIDRFERIGDFWTISLKSPDQRYDCKYVATNPLFPLTVSTITARLMDFGKKIEEISPGVTNS